MIYPANHNVSTKPANSPPKGNSFKEQNNSNRKSKQTLDKQTKNQPPELVCLK